MKPIQTTYYWFHRVYMRVLPLYRRVEMVLERRGEFARSWYGR